MSTGRKLHLSCGSPPRALELRNQHLSIVLHVKPILTLNCRTLGDFRQDAADGPGKLDCDWLRTGKGTAIPVQLRERHDLATQGFHRRISDMLDDFHGVGNSVARVHAKMWAVAVRENHMPLFLNRNDSPTQRR